MTTPKPKSQQTLDAAFAKTRTTLERSPHSQSTSNKLSKLDQDSGPKTSPVTPSNKEGSTVQAHQAIDTSASKNRPVTSLASAAAQQPSGSPTPSQRKNKKKKDKRQQKGKDTQAQTEIPILIPPSIHRGLSENHQTAITPKGPKHLTFATQSSDKSLKSAPTGDFLFENHMPLPVDLSQNKVTKSFIKSISAPGDRTFIDYKQVEPQAFRNQAKDLDLPGIMAILKTSRMAGPINSEEIMQVQVQDIIRGAMDSKMTGNNVFL
jgi:hypothetical protein